MKRPVDSLLPKPARVVLRSRRRGAAYRKLMVGLVAVALVPALAYSATRFFPGFQLEAGESGPIMYTVARGPFLHEITERGNVESASNVEIRCEVQAKNGSGTTILEIIPEGAYVQQGDVLCRLDASALEDDCTKQEIVCSNSEAALTKAENDYATAQISLKEYEQGTFEQEKLAIEAEISTAEEMRNRAVDYANYSEGLAARGYVSQLQLEADQFAKVKAQKDYDIAQQKLHVLENFTKAKTIKELESAIATAQAALEAARRTHKLDTDQLALIQSQIAKCVLRAPEPGQVVYANEISARGGNRDIIIQEGEIVREHQVIIRLPDPKRMQVKAKINEARVSLVTVGMPAVIRMDAFPDVELKGHVIKVNDYPAPVSFFSPNIKEYETVVTIDEPPEGMRPGLTAAVQILVEKRDNVLSVPVQAVFEHGGKFYCAQHDDGRQDQWAPRELSLGSTNDKMVIVNSGLEAGEQVVLNAAPMRSRLDLPTEKTPLPGNLVKLAEGLRTKTGDEAPETSPGVKGESAAAPPQSPPPGNGAAPGGGDRAGGIDRFFKQLDADGDGRVAIDDLPENRRAALAAADANHDGYLDRGEMAAAPRAPRRPRGEAAPEGQP